MKLKGRWCVGDDGGTKREKIKGNGWKRRKGKGTAEETRGEERKE